MFQQIVVSAGMHLQLFGLQNCGGKLVKRPDLSKEALGPFFLENINFAAFAC